MSNPWENMNSLQSEGVLFDNIQTLKTWVEIINKIIETIQKPSYNIS